MQFLLNTKKICSIEGENPNKTILEYLRENNLVGTKEGCASGDCGACTVVIAEADKNYQSLSYRSINSCIALIGNLVGKQLITVEGLNEGETLHPAQQAMVDYHGSQCGYCTPGFILSLFALYKNHFSQQTTKKITLENTLEALGGNLCRCTGYRPIIQAALKMKKKKDIFDKKAPETLAILKKIKENSLFHPKSVDDLVHCWEKNPTAHLIGGGTDLALQITQRHQELGKIIYLNHIREINFIAEEKEKLVIGSAVSLTKTMPLFEKYFPSFALLLGRFASQQIRNQASFGGNLANASAIADTPPALIVWGAKLILRKGKQTRKVAVKDFFVDYRKTILQPQEFIEQIEIPKPSSDSIFKIYKISKRMEDDISALCGAFSLELDKNKKLQKIAIAFCGMAAFPKNAEQTEKFLMGQNWDKEIVEEASFLLAKDYTPISDFRATADYRMQVCQNLLKKFYLETTQKTSIRYSL